MSDSNGATKVATVRTGKMPKQSRGEITRENILISAATAFDATGYAATSINDIIAASKSTKGALYFHFPAKSDIAQELSGEVRVGDVCAGEVRAGEFGVGHESPDPALPVRVGRSSVEIRFGTQPQTSAMLDIGRDQVCLGVAGHDELFERGGVGVGGLQLDRRGCACPPQSAPPPPGPPPPCPSD